MINITCSLGQLVAFGMNCYYFGLSFNLLWSIFGWFDVLYLCGSKIWGWF